MAQFLDSSKRYELSGLLGRGGLGEVLLAKDTQLDRWVAIKRLYKSPESSEETAAAAIREARVLASLQHPNVVIVHDIFEFYGDVLVVMEYVTGRTLQEIGDHAPMVFSDFVTVATQSLMGVAAAHEIDVLHCDIKPGNIMVSPGKKSAWKVTVLDFGMARLSRTAQLRTPDDEERVLLGSIYFMAPEQFEEEQLDVRTDLYSLGCVFYFILAGALPFEGETVEDVANAHLDGRHTPIEELRPDLPRPVCTWLRQLMVRQPADRPASAEKALASFLEAIRGGSTSEVAA